MFEDIFVPILVIIGTVAAVWFLTVRLRRPKSVYVTDYQKAVRFRNGIFCGLLAPGNRRFNPGRDTIEIVDMRPHPFVVERVMYQDVLLSNSVISIGGILLVRDPQLAVTRLKDIVNDSMAIIRDVLRFATSRTIADPSSEGRIKLATNIESEINKELASRGVQVSQLEITEIWAQSVKPATLAGAN
jgi:hypothetical protein